MPTCPHLTLATDVALGVCRAITPTFVSSAKTVCTKRQTARARFVFSLAPCVKTTLCATHVLKGTSYQGLLVLRVRVIARRAMTRVTVRLVLLGITTLLGTRARPVLKLMRIVSTAAHRLVSRVSLDTC